MAEGGAGAKGVDNAGTNSGDEWERRLVTGDLPEDFLRVTEPTDGGGGGGSSVGGEGHDSVTAQASATMTPFQRNTPAAAAVPAAAPTTVATGALLDLGEDIPAPPDRQQHQPTHVAVEGQGKPQGRDPNQSANVMEEPSRKGSATDRPMTTEERDHAMALALQKQLNMEGQQEAAARAAAAGHTMSGYIQGPPSNAQGRLTVTVAEARLAKNYGMTRMDPYCRVRVGHCVYETPTCANGAREPKWNKTFNCYLLAGVKRVDIEIYDECTFQADALIAHSSFDIPESVTGSKNEVADEWWPLSGQEGHEKEGAIHIILSLQPIQATGPATGSHPPVGSVRVVSSAAPTPGMPHPQHQVVNSASSQQAIQQPQPVPELTEEQLDEYTKMFPNLDKEVILSVYQENRGNQEGTVTGLLQLSGGS